MYYSHDRKTALFISLLVLMFSFPVTAVATGECKYDCAHLQEGLKLVETFYQYLLSDIPTEQCPKIFTNCYSETGTNSKQKYDAFKFEWSYLRQNKRLFMTNDYLDGSFCKPTDFYDKATKSFFFMNPPDLEHLSDGYLYIVLVVSTGKPDGIWKQIAFPIVYLEKKEKYAISLLGIKINGAIIEMNYGECPTSWNRDFDWFERMGFK